MDQTHLKILLVEDHVGDVQLARIMLTDATSGAMLPPVDMMQAPKLANAIAFMKQLTFDIILLDLNLPDSSSIETFDQLTAVSPDTPIIILTGMEDERIAELAVQRGAQDYLVKSDLTPSLLSRAIRYAIERQHLRVALTESQQALAISEAQRHNIITHNADGILILDHDQIVHFVNPAAEEILGQSSSDLLQKPFPMPITPQQEISEMTITTTNGRRVIEIRQVTIEWNQQEMVQASLRDITDHKEAKNLLAQKAAQLELKNYELDQFNMTMAHQVQGLLAQIIGYTSLIEMDYTNALPGDVGMILHRVQQSASKMNNVVNELLLLGSVRHDDVAILPVEMHRVINEVHKRLRFQIDAANGRITYHTDPETWPRVLGQPSWLEEVWVNYITNGLKYGGDPPNLELGVDTPRDNYIRFWVRDNGNGISPKDQERLFKPHSRLQQPHVRGEGLGLSIVHRIIDKCGGKVGVDSTVGSGSTFWFTLQEASPDPFPETEHSMAAGNRS